MESGERLATPPPQGSIRSVASPSTSSPNTASKSAGHLFRMAGDAGFGMSTVSSAFPMVSHPAFSLYSALSGRSHFGGLGTLGIPAALTPQAQLGTFPEWWRAADTPVSGAATLFPPLLGLPSLFSSPALSPDPGPGRAPTPSRSTQASTKGLNGALNGNTKAKSASSGASSTSSSPSPATTTADSSKTPKPGMNPQTLDLLPRPALIPPNHDMSPKGTRNRGKPHKAAGKGQSCGHNHKNKTDEDPEKSNHTTKAKAPCKAMAEISSNSDSQSGASSDSSSDTLSSLDSADLEEEEEDDEDEDESIGSEDSDSEREQRASRKVKAARVKESFSLGADMRSADPHSGLLASFFPRQGSSQSPSLSQASALLFKSSRPREQSSKHTSVIQATGLAASKPVPLLSQPSQDRDASSKPPASPKPLCLALATKPPSLSSSPAPLSLSLSPKNRSISTSPKPLSLTLSPKPPSLSSSPKPPTLSPSYRPVSLAPSPTPSSPRPPSLVPEALRAAGRNPPEKPHATGFSQLKQEPFRMVFQPREGLDVGKHLTETRSTSPPLPAQRSRKRQPPRSAPQPPGLFLPSSGPEGDHANGALHGAVQEAPLALVARPRPRAPAGKTPAPTAPPCSSAPINLSTGAKGLSRTPAGSGRAVALARPSTKATQLKGLGSGRGPGPGALHGQQHQSLAEVFRGMESDIPSSRDSDDTAEEEDDGEEEDDKDSDDSLSDSGSNLDSDSDDDEEDDDIKDEEMETDTESGGTPLKLTKNSASFTDSSPSSSSLNLQIHTAHAMPTPTIVSSAGALTYHSTPSASYNLATPPGKRRRVTDEQALRRPLEYGWRREVRFRAVCGRMQGEVTYYAPCGKKLRQYSDVMKYLARNGISGISRDHFSFSAKIRVGDFYEAREGPEGFQWCPLRSDEVAPHVLALEGRKGHPKSQELPRPPGPSSGDPTRPRQGKGRQPNVVEPEVASAADAKLLRKLEAQEIARQAAQLKLMRKLEKQALARAAKEAKRQQALLAAEEKRRQKEHLKLLKQQEKIRRIEQIRMEKELRAQQILEAKRKKKEEAANAKILEAEKRIKEKELRRQQALILKQQELERHRLDMERERRRQHMMLIKAMEARKRAEERERLKQEKRDEKRLNKERKLELRRLELEMAKELNKPNEDLCLADHKELPELPRLPGLLLPGACFADCLMVLQFLRCFGKVLSVEGGVPVPTLHVLQAGLLNLGPSGAFLQELLVRLLSAAVCDPGLPPGQRAKTALGEHLSSVAINQENVSEILHIYMAAHCGQTELAPLAESLKTKAFQAHTPVQKASILAFLVNELACSKSVVTEIDKNIDNMTNLRRDKWVVEGSVRKLRSIYAKRTGKRESGVGGDEGQSLGTPTAARKRKRKAGDSEDDEEDDDDSDDQGEEEDEEEEEGGKKGKKAEACEEEDEGDQTASVEELERQIERLSKQQSQIRRKLFESSHLLRSMTLGQDRYRRRYWALPQCGGVFVEAMESGEGAEELQREREKVQSAPRLLLKEEPVEKPLFSSPEVKRETPSPEPLQEKNSLNLFLQKPGSFSKLSKLLEVAKMSPEPTPHPQGPLLTPHLSANAQTAFPTILSAISNQEVKSEPSAPLLIPAYLGNLQQQLHSDQLYRALTENNAHWFSLLPRSPCDASSVTSAHGPLPVPSSPQPCGSKGQSPTASNAATRSPSSLSPSTNSHTTPCSSSPSRTAALGSSSPASLQMKPATPVMGLPLCHWPTAFPGSNVAFGGLTMPSTLAGPYAPAEGTGNPFLLPSLATVKSESPGPGGEKPPTAPSPALEGAKNQDLASPQPVPEEMLRGWWKVSTSEELSSIVDACHPRGVRERVLQKQLQKHMESITQACAKNKGAAVIDVSELEQRQVCEETVRGWCVEEHAMDQDIRVLQRVEELERRVASASLQVKGWQPAERQSLGEDLLYYEHKAEVAARSHAGVARRANNPLDVAVARLSELERSIERRYLKSPLGLTIQVTVDNVGMVTVPAPAPSHNADGDGGEEDVAPGMRQWRKALAEVHSAAQLSLCLQQLQRSIAWERSIMKVYCQMCRKGDNEELLLLCDGCDRGCHTYCHKPPITSIPEGDWFCPACLAKASDPSQTSKKQACRPGGGVAGKKTPEVKRMRRGGAGGEGSEEEPTSGSSTPKKGGKEAKKKKGGEGPPAEPAQPAQQESPARGKKAKTARDSSRDQELCRLLLAELLSHQDSWPFMMPVNPKSVPGYRKVIKRPMDFSTIREKLSNSQYLNLETFIIDVNLVFDNCEKFNEDNSEIGRAGHSMRRFFQRRWTELLQQMN